MKEPVIIISANGVLERQCIHFEMAHRDWGMKCRNIRASYKQKTSRMVKGDKEYEYTKWYRVKDDNTGGLECIGDTEPDWKKLLPPEPKPERLPAVEYEGHLVMEKKDYEANSKLFKEYLVFKLEDCTNFIHPLYKNLDKALKGVSVREGRVSSARSRLRSGTETVDKTALMKKCRGLWDDRGEDEGEEE